MSLTIAEDTGIQKASTEEHANSQLLIKLAEALERKGIKVLV